MLLPEELIKQTLVYYFSRISPRGLWIYAFVLLVLLAVLLALPFLYVDVSVKSTGMIRPIAERSEIKALVSAPITEIYVTENQSVKQNELLLKLRTENLAQRTELLSFQLKEYEDFSADLQNLVKLDTNSLFLKNIFLQTSHYQQQYNQWLSQISQKKDLIERIGGEAQADRKLYETRSISKREWEQKESELLRLKTDYWVFVQQQINLWQQDLNNYKLKTHEIRNQMAQIGKESNLYELKVPITGTVQQLVGKYVGYNVQAGEVLAVISPDSTLIAECYVSPKDIGLIRQSQKVHFQIDAFDYREWGIAEGEVVSIAQDVEIQNQNPIFRVKCSLKTSTLFLRNNYKGQIKKGMSFQARFVVQKRNLFQLLFDNINDWLNPN